MEAGEQLFLSFSGPGGAEEAEPGPSVFPSGEPGVSGDFWVLGIFQEWGAIAFSHICTQACLNN